MTTGFRMAIVALATVALGACSSSDDEFFVAELSASNEVPPVNSGATGTAGFTLQGGTVHYTISVSGIDAVVGAHIHSGPSVANGPIRVVLFPGPGLSNFTDPTTRLDGYLTSGSFTAAEVTGISMEELLEQMRAGNAYVNVHTTAHRPGEIRGQVTSVR